MSKVRCLCLYCGREWDQAIYGAAKPKCSDCKETKAIRVRKDPGRGNVFGYEEDEKPKVSYGYNED